MQPLVYVETTIFSFYHDDRPSPDVQAMRTWTREWWEHSRDRYELVTSLAVLEELSRGSLPHRHAAHGMALTVPVSDADASVLATVQVYIQRKVMPADPLGDAMHLALASHLGCDFLLTWNCRHLANANKFGHIRRVNDELGLKVPALVTPQQLLDDPTLESETEV